MPDNDDNDEKEDEDANNEDERGHEILIKPMECRKNNKQTQQQLAKRQKTIRQKEISMETIKIKTKTVSKAMQGKQKEENYGQKQTESNENSKPNEVKIGEISLDVKYDGNWEIAETGNETKTEDEIVSQC